ncbi:acyltransferase [Lactobacillus sp. CC-MHH1034]|uniref:acyltransferase family protein n=1 Tax=Agrilactobacillus fermenti TaxID=2586909 RepID=UPI001E374982|nr:acyltransferase [Agrilactobacillus fermenti]MCD2257363.1 acyltransferase [Agrilactobacillus fermenti]
MLETNFGRHAKKKRIEWIDIAKALGIVAVVVGHAYPAKDTFYETTYWWHMPLFFLIGGFFIKSLKVQEYTVPQFIRRKVWPLLRDYLLAGATIILINFFVEQRNAHYTLGYFGRLLYGGTELNGYTSAFWFMTVYILALIVVTFIITFIPNKMLQFLIVGALFLLGTSYKDAQSAFGFPMPWNADVTLMAAFYMWIGYFSFKYLKRLVQSRWLLALSIATASGLIVAQNLGMIDEVIYMKSHQITNSWFAMFVPLIFTFSVLAISYWLQFTPLKHFLAIVGKHTMIIMFSHKAVFFVLEKINFDAWTILSLVGITLPIVAAIIGKKMQQHWRFARQSTTTS